MTPPVKNPSAMPLVIDTDPGIDDAMAIVLAASIPQLQLVGLTSVFGNVDVDLATNNARQLAALCGLDIQIARGSAVPSVQAPEPHATFVHGDSGFGDAPIDLPLDPSSLSALDAAEFIIDASYTHAGTLVLLAIGPLTNLAATLARDPSLTSRVARVVIMGGAVDCPGNVNAYAEANIWQDPHAAQAVFDAPWATPPLVVGLDVTEQLVLTPDDMAAVAAGSPKLGGWLARAHDFYFDFHAQHYQTRTCFLHDPAAVLALIEPGLFTTSLMPLAVTLAGETKGQTRPAASDAPSPGVEVCTGVDKAAAVRHMLGICKRLDDALPRGRLTPETIP